LDVLPFSEIVFGNKDEFLAFGKKLYPKIDNLIEIGTHVAKSYKIDKSRPRTVLITQG